VAPRESNADLAVKTSLGSVGGLAILAPLGVEEERSLYPVIRAGRDAAAQLLLGRDGDPARRRRLLRQRHDGQEAESMLLRSTLGLVRARVTERGYRFSNDELEAAGVEGLVNALRRFDSQRGIRFSTYANYWITKMVNESIQQQVGVTDAEMRLVLKFQRLERAKSEGSPSKREVAKALDVSLTKAQEVMELSREIASRRFSSLDMGEVPEARAPSRLAEPPAWVISELRRLCGEDFDAFWQYTFRTMTMQEIASTRGISRQAMTKRIERCRKAVRESPEAARLEGWLQQQ